MDALDVSVADALISALDGLLLAVGIACGLLGYAVRTWRESRSD